MKSISDNDYKNVQKVWNTIDKKNLGCYHDIYFKTDVLLLANVFETFRNACLKHYKLDPAHFCKAYGLEYWEHEAKHKDCELCLDEFRLELLIDMLLMFENRICGGIAQTVKHYAKANNKNIKDQYNPDEKNIYLQ